MSNDISSLHTIPNGVNMDLLKAPSIQSLLDSDLESVESLQYVDLEELDDVEYALPTSKPPTLEEVLSSEELDVYKTEKECEDPAACSALQVEFMQAISQQLTQAQERSSAGVATTLSVGPNGRLTVGTAHGHLLSFHDQTLRWVCNAHSDNGAVTCLSYNQDGTRLLAGFARGNVFQYESIHGIVLRKVTLGGETWGTLRVTWAGASGLALDTGGSVWLMKFLRPLGVRSARVSCLFSGSRGEVVAMTAQDARVLALATLSRVIIVAGGRAAGVRLDGPPNVLPVLEWCMLDSKILVSARANVMQWLMVSVNGTSINLRPFKRMELKTTPLWLGRLGGSLAIFDSDENLRLWGEDYDKPLDLSQIEPVYSSAFFKVYLPIVLEKSEAILFHWPRRTLLVGSHLAVGLAVVGCRAGYEGHWTDGRVSRAMCQAGETALGGVCISEGTLSLLGRRGVLRVKPRDVVARAHAFITCGRYAQGLRLLCSTQGEYAKKLSIDFIAHICDRPHILNNKNIAVQIVKLCLLYDLSDELWNSLWESCSKEKAFVEALGDAAVRGEFFHNPPSPDFTQDLIERLAELEPELVERVVASLPLTALDPHRASVFTRERRLWRGVGAIAAALDGSSGAMRELVAHVSTDCAGGAECRCAGGALLLAAADALAGRGAAGRALPDHARPSARHDALHTLLSTQGEYASPLCVLVRHDTSAAMRLLEQCAREPPFAGPLGKQNRLRIARALLNITPDIQDTHCRTEILEFVAGQLHSGALPLDLELIKSMQEMAASTAGERADRAWLAVLMRVRAKDPAALRQHRDSVPRARVVWKLDSMLDRHEDAMKEFFQIDNPSTKDIEEFFDYLQSKIDVCEAKNVLLNYLPALAQLSPRASAALINDSCADMLLSALNALPTERKVEFGQCLLESGRLKGDAVKMFLKSLCISRPEEVKEFLTKNVGILRPEDALSIVKELGPRNAESICLEATGDHSGALEVLLESVTTCSESGDLDGKEKYIIEACELCVRIGSSVPRSLAADMWRRLLRCVGSVPVSLLFEAIAYLPLEELMVSTCDSKQAALTILNSGRGGGGVWRCAAQLAKRDAHERLAFALAAARRGLAVRGACTSCCLPLATGAVRTLHCAQASHTTCAVSTVCACGRHVPDSILPLPPHTFHAPALSRDCALLLLAPPRPDLEGVV